MNTGRWHDSQRSFTSYHSDLEPPTYLHPEQSALTDGGKAAEEHQYVWSSAGVPLKSIWKMIYLQLLRSVS